jgi:hypothetical protein
MHPMEFAQPMKKQPPHESHDDTPRSEFLDAMRKGVLIGAAILVLVLPPVMTYRHLNQPAPQSQSHAVQSAPPNSVPAPRAAIRLADFGAETPSVATRQVANWIVDSRDHKTMSFAIVDKKDARVYVFDPAGHLTASSPALMGAAIGDDSVPGIGEKPLSQVLPEEKTTPAGRFVAELGENTHHEDIVWVSYDLAVSMHRVRPLVKAERRLERLASPTPEDNRISFGCINLPPQFYEQVLKPAVVKTGVVVYVLPETRTPAQVFASYYEVDPVKLAQR